MQAMLAELKQTRIAKLLYRALRSDPTAAPGVLRALHLLRTGPLAPAWWSPAGRTEDARARRRLAEFEARQGSPK